jgi:hypothetical protein
MIRSDFGEGLEFDYARTTCLVIDAFGLTDVGKERLINISASIDAAKLTKNITHTSAGLKMTDVQGRDPLKNKRSTKESFKLFQDVFQFFRLAGEPNENWINNPDNSPKFQWEELQDLQPLDVTITTDMAADWKLVGAGGGVKKTKHFCTVCPLQSDDAHQPNVEHCDRFCSERGDDGQCYHHPILCSNVKEELLQEAEMLKVSIQLDLEIV